MTYRYDTAAREGDHVVDALEGRLRRFGSREQHQAQGELAFT
jgi:hypothetical protein